MCNNIVRRQVTSVANIANVCWLNDRDSSAGRGVNFPLRHSVQTVSLDHQTPTRWVPAHYLPKSMKLITCLHLEPVSECVDLLYFRRSTRFQNEMCQLNLLVGKWDIFAFQPLDMFPFPTNRFI
jgi:hypothetical protein